MRIRPVVALFALMLAAVATTSADVIYLTDGTRVEGDVKRSPEGWNVTDASGKVTVVPSGKVKSIELKGATTRKAPDAVEQRLASLRRSVENVDELAEIVDRFKRFIDQNKGTELAKEAEKDLAVWVDRKNRGLVKVGGQWVTAEERQALLANTFAVVSQARQLIKDARFKEADAALVKATQVDPTNPSVQYLRGVLKYRTNEVPAARKAFEQVIEQIPNHMPSLNNLGVILARQKQEAASLGMFDRAMQAEPRTRVVLDNFAEGFNAMSQDQRKAPIVQRALKRFLEQDEQLQAEMLKQGQYRWGSTWVSKEQLDDLKRAEEQNKAKLDQLAADFDAAQVRIKTIDDDIAATQRSIALLDSRRYSRDGSGQIVQADPSPRMLDMQADIQRMQQDRSAQVTRMQQLRVQAKEIEKQVPVPRYTGVQKLIETQGTPLKFADGSPTQLAADETPATTQPATDSSAAPADPPAPPRSAPTTSSSPLDGPPAAASP